MALQKYNPAVSCDTVIVRFADVPTTCRLYTLCRDGLKLEGCVCGEVMFVCVLCWWIGKGGKVCQAEKNEKIY